MVYKSGLGDLELRLEHVKRLGNLRLQNLKRLYDRESVTEGYREARSELHIHGKYRGVSLCGLCHKAEVESVDDPQKIVVFAEVGQTLKRSRPLASVVRLQPLDRCDMHDTESGQIGFLLTDKALFDRFDRKLQSVALALNSAVKFGKPRDKVVQCGTEVVGDLCYKDSNGVGNGDVFFDFNVGHSPVLSWRNVEIELIEDRGLSLRGDEFFMKDFELIEMFACPVYKGVSAIQ